MSHRRLRLQLLSTVVSISSSQSYAQAAMQEEVLAAGQASAARETSARGNRAQAQHGSENISEDDDTVTDGEPRDDDSHALAASPKASVHNKSQHESMEPPVTASETDMGVAAAIAAAVADAEAARRDSTKARQQAEVATRALADERSSCAAIVAAKNEAESASRAAEEELAKVCVVTDCGRHRGCCPFTFSLPTAVHGSMRDRQRSSSVTAALPCS